MLATIELTLGTQRVVLIRERVDGACQELQVSMHSNHVTATYRNVTLIPVDALVEALRDTQEELLRKLAVRDGADVAVPCVCGLGCLPRLEELEEVDRLGGGTRAELVERLFQRVQALCDGCVLLDDCQLGPFSVSRSNSHRWRP